MVAVRNSCRIYFLGCVVSVLRRESLSDLDTAAVAVHVAEASDVHKDVEAELMPGAERSKHFIVFAAMAQAKIYDFAADNLACSRDCLSNLPVGIMTIFVDQ